MAYDEGLAQRLREVYVSIPEVALQVTEKKMFGGIAFMVRGHMSCGVVDDTLMVRVGPDQYEIALERPHARKMDFTGRPMKGFIYVPPEGIASDDELSSWVSMSLDFVYTLPPK